jgi:hypothetical protein
VPDLLSTFKDSWTTTALSACWDVPLDQALGHGTHGAADAGEGVQLHYDGTNGPPAAGANVMIRTFDTDWLFTDDASWVFIADYPAGAEAFFSVAGNSSATPFPGSWSVEFFLTAAGAFVWEIDTPSGFFGNTPGDPDTGRRWWRARHDSGTGLLYAESSVDGSTWVTDGSGSIGVGVSLVGAQAFLSGGVSPVIFKHFNGGGKPCCPSHPCNKQRSRAQLVC